LLNRVALIIVLKIRGSLGIKNYISNNHFILLDMEKDVLPLASASVLGFMAWHIAESEPHRGVEQLVARRAHNPKVVGSSPTPATKKEQSEMVALFLL
jgi:hypothetical protein